MRCSGYFRRRWPATHVSWLGFARRQQGTGRTNCRLADVLSSAARARRGGVHGQQCDISGILLWAVSGCCYHNGGLRNRRWANAITKHGGKGGWQTLNGSLPSTTADIESGYVNPLAYWALYAPYPLLSESNWVSQRSDSGQLVGEMLSSILGAHIFDCPVG